MTHARFRDFTSAELAQLREASRPSTKKEGSCLWCERVVSMRSDQKFCSASCRAAYANAAARLAYEKLLREKAAWELEREELIRELSALRKRLQE